MDDGEYIAVLDRFEGKQAVLEVSSEDGRDEVVVDRMTLPADGQHTDAILTVRI